MHPVIEAALKDWRIFNESGQWWASFDAMITPAGQIIVRLEYGVIHSNGFKERSLRVVHYFERNDGTIALGV